nr:4'-phosphopantetheinyl transferase superfamily protein [Gorillibacterium timonense]
MLRFGKNEYGKPFFENERSIHFNLSHSGDWVVAVMGSQPVGIDVEQMKEMDYHSIARSFFAIDEYNDLLEQPANKQLDYFYSLWTRKESYIKQRGLGLSIPLDSFAMSRIEKAEDAFIPAENLEGHVCFLSRTLDEQHRMAVCIPEELLKEPVLDKLMTMDTLIAECNDLLQQDDQ